MSSREFPTEWGVDPKCNVMQYATEQCEQKCVCSRAVRNQKLRSCSSLKFSWRFEDYYDAIIIKNPVLCKLYEKFTHYPLLNEKYYRGTLLETNHNVNEILVICGPYLSEVPTFAICNDIPLEDLEETLEELGGIETIREIISSELAKPINHGRPLTNPPFAKYDTLSYYCIPVADKPVEFLPPPILFIGCCSSAVIYTYVQSLYIELKKRQSQVDCTTLQYALRNTSVTLESHLEIQRYNKLAKKNVHQVVSKCYRPKNMTKEILSSLLQVFERISTSIVLQSYVLPCGDIFCTEPSVTIADTQDNYQYNMFEQAHVYKKLLDYDENTVVGMPQYSSSGKDISLKQDYKGGILRRKNENRSL
ncbi:hypothetical protein NCAS_0H01110 [Naumovozyma castellii]|uniref:Uncharacterized protein n=1 Tax=Naumovozyma castellii TaxID=27288 RepID=G0VIU4_NAUCA|nr:hypothetical protein NCAS_0H01110 [Naumovozyma castellii CBS 4309]CCC71421.1 hypothetical protein NCAS_0H01110 [Naumovozyma castellii CBS 4309]